MPKTIPFSQDELTIPFSQEGEKIVSPVGLQSNTSVDLESNKIALKTTPAEKAKEIGIGAGKALGTTFSNIGKFAAPAVEQTAGRVGNFLAGKGFVPTTELGDSYSKMRNTIGEAEGVYQQIGFSAERIGEFILPAGKVIGAGNAARSAIQATLGMNPLARFAGLLSKSATEGVGFGTVGTAQQGKKDYTSAAIGAGMPLLGGLIRVGATFQSEVLGVTTGAGGDIIRLAFEAGKKGGKASDEFLTNLRGYVSPEAVVNEARDAFNVIKQQRTALYVKQLADITKYTKSFDTSPIISTLAKKLKDFHITTAADGTLDFSRSTIRFDSAAQDTVNKIVSTMKGFGSRAGDRTVIGIDSLKRSLDDLYAPTSNVRALVQSVKSSARSILAKVPGYDKIEKDFAERSDLIRNVQQALNTGDKANIDTAFKKIVSAFRVNNKFRKDMVEELDAITGGALKYNIAGQQLEELLPRGLMRAIGTAGMGVAAISGNLALPLLNFAAFLSPRIVGELIYALGLTTKQTTRLFGAVESLIGSGAVPAATVGGASQAKQLYDSKQ